MDEDLQALIEKNSKSIDALNGTVSSLTDLSAGAPLSQIGALNAQIIRAHADITHLQIVDAHLQAATVLVTPLSAAETATLDQLAAKLDQQIQNDATINDALSIAKDVIDAAEQIGSIASGHTPS